MQRSEFFAGETLVHPALGLHAEQLSSPSTLDFVLPCGLVEVIRKQSHYAYVLVKPLAPRLG